MKIVTCLFLAIVLVFVGMCGYSWLRYFNYERCCPDCSNLLGTHWQSEDGTIEFVSSWGDSPNGQMVVDDEKIEIRVGFLKSEGWILRADTGECLGDFVCDYKSTKRFVAKVLRDTPYFNESDKITFYRVDQ